MTPTMKTAEAYDAEILSNATRFEASLFLGKGKYAHAAETTLEDIKIAADMLKEENKGARGEPMIYALDEAGNKALVSGQPYKAKGKLSLAPLGEATPETITSAGREDEIIDAAPLFGGISAIIAAAAAGETTPLEKLAKDAAEVIAAAKAPKAPKAKLPKLESALNELMKPAKAPKAPKAEKPADAPKESKPRGPSGKYAAQIADAANGILPPEPDFSAETHKSYRKRLFAITAMIDAKDIAGLKAETTEPKCSSRIPLCRYRDMAITALEIQAAK